MPILKIHPAAAGLSAFDEIEENLPDSETGKPPKNNNTEDQYSRKELSSSKIIKDSFRSYLSRLREKAQSRGEQVYEEAQEKGTPLKILPATGWESSVRLEEAHFNHAFYQISPYFGAEDADMRGSVTLAAILSSIDLDETPNQEIAQFTLENGEVRKFQVYVPDSFKDIGKNIDLSGMAVAAERRGFNTQSCFIDLSNSSEKQTLSSLRRDLIHQINNPRAQIVLYFDSLVLGRAGGAKSFAVAAAYDPGTDSVLVMNPADRQGPFWTALSSLYHAMQPGRPHQNQFADMQTADSGKGWLCISRPDASAAAADIRFNNMMPAKKMNSSGQMIKILPFNAIVKDSVTRFRRSLHGSFDQLNHLLNHQQGLTKCAVASACAVLNSFRPGEMPVYTQDSFLNEKTDQIKARGDIVPADPYIRFASKIPGLNLDELNAIIAIKEPRFHCEVVHMEAPEAEAVAALRRTLLATLDDPYAHVILNFHGQDLGRKTGGHAAVAGAYDKSSDSVLVMDPAGHRHELYFWISLSDLYQSMRNPDWNNRPRGYLVLSDGIMQTQLEKIIQKRADKKDVLQTRTDLGKLLAEKGFPRNIAGVHFNQQNIDVLNGMHLDNLAFTNCRFEKFLLNSKINVLSNCNFRNCIFEREQFANMTIFNTNFINCHFNNASFMNAKLKNCIFEYGNANELMLINARLNRVDFKSLDIKNSSFQYSTMNHVNFCDVGLPGTNFLCTLTEKTSIDAKSKLQDTLFCGNEDNFDIHLNAKNTVNLSRPVTSILVSPEDRSASIPWVIPNIISGIKSNPLYVAMQTPVVTKEKIDREVDAVLDIIESTDTFGQHSIKQQLMLMIESEAGKMKSMLLPETVKIYKLAQTICKHTNLIILPGGEDIPPRLFGQKQHEKTDWQGDWRRTLLELCLRHVKKQPLFAICRSFQLEMADQFGLDQDINPPRTGLRIFNRAFRQDLNPKNYQGLFGNIFLNGIPCAIWHHQAPQNIEGSKTGSGIEISLMYDAPDGTSRVGAFESSYTAGPPILGMQPHPEFLAPLNVIQGQQWMDDIDCAGLLQFTGDFLTGLKKVSQNTEKSMDVYAQDAERIKSITDKNHLFFELKNRANDILEICQNKADAIDFAAGFLKRLPDSKEVSEFASGIFNQLNITNADLDAFSARRHFANPGEMIASGILRLMGSKNNDIFSEILRQLAYTHYQHSAVVKQISLSSVNLLKRRSVSTQARISNNPGSSVKRSFAEEPGQEKLQGGRKRQKMAMSQ